jgi:hypothetical protein
VIRDQFYPANAARINFPAAALSDPRHLKPDP